MSLQICPYYEVKQKPKISSIKEGMVKNKGVHAENVMIDLDNRVISKNGCVFRQHWATVSSNIGPRFPVTLGHGFR